MFEAKENISWAGDIGPEMEGVALDEYFNLWISLADVHLDADGIDSVRWDWEANGEFSIRLTHAAKFAGREAAPYADLAWESMAPRQCCFFTWLAMKNRC